MGNLRKSFSEARCLVIGGGGFIGINLSNALARAGAQVDAYGRRLSIRDSLISGVRWTSADFADRAKLAEAVEHADFVFHLVSSSTPSSANADPAADVMDNLVTTLHLLDICRVQSFGRLVFISSGGTVYGIPSMIPVPETAPTDPISAHGVQKLAVEKYLALYRHLYDLDYLVLRVANPYGPMQIARKSQGVVAALMMRALADEPVEIWGSGDVVRDFIHVQDVVRAILMASLHPGPSRLFNLGSGMGTSIKTVIDDIERVVGRGPLKRIHLPARAVDVPSNVLDIRRIREEVGWQPEIEWMDGLRKTMEWTMNAKENGLI
ncbi:MAG: UDP-glucose 4-epimerase [Alphaproteobacteria bacterium]|jgi:UDP-glucose 4-epimerase|nr:UDP-glucose 4-epimerase [Alphaproteobacteria bacterium]